VRARTRQRARAGDRGATGGVGSRAVPILARRGYEVATLTGKCEVHACLGGIGASAVLDRAQTLADTGSTVGAAALGGAVDCVGGYGLAYVLRTLRSGASVAASGSCCCAPGCSPLDREVDVHAEHHTGGARLETTVFPFILRGVTLLGIDNAHPDRPP